jgi:hypothetical protein
MDGRSRPCGSFTGTPNGFNIQRICDGGSVQLLQVFTECLPTITIRVANTGACPVSLFVQQKNGLQQLQIEPNFQIFASFDFVMEVTAQFCNSPGENCNIIGEVEVHGCVSCG